ncbi:MAG: polynucleotide adenylyltransferase PcnB [Gammaproteobacteria bacterium]|nr:polynucleotide adenylyltransferase PcnB [Gammaproteobacteria bacterium]
MEGNLKAPQIIPRSAHPVSRADISDNALKVLNRLHRAGYQAFLVGGAVRDLLVGQEPKDFDVATDARPEDVRELFRNCRLIGRRFRLAHVHFGRDIIEVATFRGDSEDGVKTDAAGRILRDNIYGDIDDDVWRRDFTANALYYNIADFSIWDYTGGAKDIEAGVIRMIGDAEARYREDPVRMLRAIRFSAKLGFELHPDTAGPLKEMAAIIADVPPARLFDESLKLFLTGIAQESYEQLDRFGLLEHLLPATVACSRLPGAASFRQLLTLALQNTDNRCAENKSVTPVFLFAVLLWGPITQRVAAIRNDNHGAVFWLHRATDEILSEQQEYVAVPRRLAVPMRDIICLQTRFAKRSGKRALALLDHPRFRAAYDLMLLRVEAGEEDPELAEFWTTIQTLSAEDQAKTFNVSATPGSRRRRGPRRRRPGPRRAPDAQ